jgi:hypothetical protein
MDDLTGEQKWRASGIKGIRMADAGAANNT